ncbi:MFS transporter [Salmonella enterica]
MGNTTIQTQSFRAVDAEQSKSKRYIIPFALLCSLFFLWAVANNLNDILLPQFQQAFTLTNFQAGLIQSAFYFGYFVIPIPAGILMKKLSYKAGIITGLFLYAVGAALFWPAAEIMNYTLFLIGLFIIAAGLGCLETAANPFVTVLGPESGGHIGLLALTLCSAFMSIQYPTIFSLGIKNLGQDTKYGSSFIVMTIIGGGIVTPVMGFVSDAAGKIPTAELVPALCFAVIFIFARFRSQAATN